MMTPFGQKLIAADRSAKLTGPLLLLSKIPGRDRFVYPFVFFPVVPADISETEV